MPTVILGINAFHGDASAALLVDGELVAAIEEERLNRVKHWAGFPVESIRACLELAGLGATDIDHVAVSFDPKANRSERIRYVLRNRPSLSSVLSRLKKGERARSIEALLQEAFPEMDPQKRGPVHHVEHHLTHLACAFLGSPWEEAALLSVDGMGDFVSTLSASGKGTDWDLLDRVLYPHSLGYLYNAVTIYLGFPRYGDEYKVMGLAPYGKPRFVEEFRKIVYPKGDTFELNLDYFTHRKGGIQMEWENGAHHVSAFHSPLLEKTLGPARRPDEACTSHHEDIAHSLQVVTQEIVLHLIQALHRKTGLPRLCLAGGVAMNSVTNGKIQRETPFEEVFIPAGAADNGTSIGAALYLWNRVLGQPRSFVQTHAYTGGGHSDETCRKAAETLCPEGCETLTVTREQLLDQVTDAIIDGKVIGWFQGGMEFGARALGNRSLLADPRRADMRDIINLKIKFREKFRPFAPSILADHVSDWFDPAEPSPFMERVLPICEEKRAEIPAVTHVDGSGRLQTVTRESNALYYDLIDRFREKTGVPILLNTSLNENEPIVRTPEEAISCFARTAMDWLVLGNTILRRVETPVL